MSFGEFWAGVFKCGEQRWGVEVQRFRADRSEIVVLVSTIRLIDGEWRAHCELGYCNDVKQCDKLRLRGFRVIEAEITWQPYGKDRAGDLCVMAPVGSPGSAAQPQLRLQSILFEDRSAPTAKQVPLTYRLTRTSPEVGAASTESIEIEADITIRRSELRQPAVRADCCMAMSAMPMLDAVEAPIDENWIGALLDRFRIQEPQQSQQSQRRQQQPVSRPISAITSKRRRRPHALIPAGFRFEDVEVIGFRIALDSLADAAIEKLVAPLNFHLGQRRSRHCGEGDFTDFRYRAASNTLVVELLRYGKMFWGRDAGSEPDQAYTSQHELLLRLMVGRVDDDTAQARDPALWVPAIFVDNPVSKFLGRELQGFEKQLVTFESRRSALDHGGFIRGSNGGRAPPMTGGPVPLTAVSRVRAVSRIGHDHGAPLFELTLPPGADDESNWLSLGDGFGLVGDPVNAATRWRQDDFVDEDFRRAFAREALGDGFIRFNSIQRTPVDKRALPPAWITGSFSMQNAQVKFPTGTAQLRFSCPPRYCRAWQTFVAMLPGGRVALPTGSWYRARSDIRLAVSDGLG